jgi:hypothetical protein
MVKVRRLKVRRLFRRSKKSPPVAIKEALYKEDVTTFDSDNCPSSILERTEIKVSTVPPTPLELDNEHEHKHAPLADEEPREVECREPTEQASPVASQRTLCCGVYPAETSPRAISFDKPLPIVPQARSRNANEAVNLESIECVFRDGSPLNAPTESLSISSAESSIPSASASAPEASTHTEPLGCCQCDSPSRLPPLDPKLWPQAPLLFRPQPNSGTKIIGIRKDSASEYLWKPNDTAPWWQILQQEWQASVSGPELQPCCPYCAILPINNGNEPAGDSLVADFETSLFQGTVLLRLRHSDGTTATPSDDTKGFFAGVPFRYQAIVRGQFKADLPLTDLVFGTRLARPCGNLPPKWVMWTALKVVGFFAPQLKTKLHISKPYSLSPLGSAARTITVEDNHNDKVITRLLGANHVEPTDPKESLTGKAYPIENALERARARKRHFDQLFIAKRQELRTDPGKTYTMEFLQHLFDYQKYTIDLGSFQPNIQDLLNGQPLQLMSASTAQDQALWSFEIWNECLLKDAKKHSIIIAP